MKLPQTVPRWSWATLGVRTGPETSPARPYDPLPGLRGWVAALSGPSEGAVNDETLKILGKVENLTENENFPNCSPVVQAHSGDACGPGNALEARQGALGHRRRRFRARRHPESGPGQSRNGLEKIHFSVQNPKFPAFRLDPDRRPGRVSGWTRTVPTVFFYV